MTRSFHLRPWHAAALMGAVAVAWATLASVQRERIARAKRLRVSVAALTNPERLMRRLRAAGL